MRVQSQAPQSPVQSPLSEGKREKPLSNHKGEQQGEKSHSDQIWHTYRLKYYTYRKHAANPNAEAGWIQSGGFTLLLVN